MLLNCGVEEDSWESLGLQGDPTSQTKGNQSWIFIGRTDTEAETPTLWPPRAKNWLIGKDSDAGKDWRQEEKGTADDKIARWHYQLDGHEFEQAWGVGDEQRSLACCSAWGHKESDTTKTELNWNVNHFPNDLLYNLQHKPQIYRCRGFQVLLHSSIPALANITLS